MNKLCVCIPTYNRKDTIQEKLDREKDLYRNNNIDVYIYDSSSDGLTEKLITEYIQDGFNNIYYKKVDRSIPSNIKILNIYKEFSCKEEYKYIWVIHDHTTVSEGAIKYILDVCSDDVDFMHLNFYSNKFETITVNNLNDFLVDSAWQLTKFGTCIIKVTYFSNVKYEKAIKYCCTPKRINFSHVVFYFCLINKNRGNIVSINFPQDEFKDILQSNKPAWNNDAVRITLECWCEAILALPREYTNKISAIRSIDKWFLSKYYFFEYKKLGIWNWNELKKYGKWIKLIDPFFWWQAAGIAILPLALSRRLYSIHVIRNLRIAKKNGESIYIFGAGRHAEEFADFIKKLGWDFDGFLVSDTSKNPCELLGKKVLCVNRSKKPALVFLAIQSKSVSSVIKYLSKFGEKNIRYALCEKEKI